MKKNSPSRTRACLLTAGGVLLVLLAAAAAIYLLLGPAPVPAAAPEPLDIALIRRLAVEGGQPLPERLNVLIVAEGAFPSALIVPRTGLQNRRMGVPAFQIVYADKTIIVDSAQPQEMHAQMFGGTPFYAGAYDRLQTAMRKSSMILLTHEHVDHIGGLANSPYLDELLPKARLTPAQIAGIGGSVAGGSRAGVPSEALDGLTPLEYDGYAQIAPGVVLIQMAGHSPGSQLIYVQLQNGAEYLLAGDVLWSTLNLERQVGRPRLMSLLLQEDPAVLGNQIRALIDLAAEPELHLVICTTSTRSNNISPRDDWETPSNRGKYARFKRPLDESSPFLSRTRPVARGCSTRTSPGCARRGF